MLDLIAVLIPARDAEETIETSIRSALVDDGTIVVVVDDGSSDRTRDRIERVLDDRLVVVEQRPLGVSAARNRATEVALSLGVEWITYLDADDALVPGRLRSQVERTRVDGSWSDVRVVLDQGPARSDEQIEDRRSRLLCHDLDLDDALSAGYVPQTGAFLFRARTLESVRWTGGLEGSTLRFVCDVRAAGFRLDHCCGLEARWYYRSGRTYRSRFRPLGDPSH